MVKESDINELLNPISEELPEGEDLSETTVYDEIKEAQQEYDYIDPFDEKPQLKKADYNGIISKSFELFQKKSKDLQIAAWLIEALVHTQKLGGLYIGLTFLDGLIKNFWEHLYPEVEDNDLDYRGNILSRFNDKLSFTIKNVIPLTDPKAGGYSFLKWEESRNVGYEKDTTDQYGNIDTNKRNEREEKISDGKLKAEDFDKSLSDTLAFSQGVFYLDLEDDSTSCQKALAKLETTLDEKFRKHYVFTITDQSVEDFKAEAFPEDVISKLETIKEQIFVGEENFKSTLEEVTGKKHAVKYKTSILNYAGSSDNYSPNLGAVTEALEACKTFAANIIKDKGIERAQEKVESVEEETGKDKETTEDEQKPAADELIGVPTKSVPVSSLGRPQIIVQQSGEAIQEEALWEEARGLLTTQGINKGLELLLNASLGVPSVREENRYRLLMAKLCLKAERPDLARPIMEQLYALINELKLEQWESPIWIAEVFDALYQCLKAGEPLDEDVTRAQELFRKMCTTDITRAIRYKN